MKQTFTLDIYNGHLIIDCDGKQVLVDTGSPVSFGRVIQLSLLGKDYPCASSLMECNIQTVSQLLERDIDVLLGMDVLANYSMTVDCQQGTLTLTDEPVQSAGAISLPLQLLMNYVTTQVQVSDETLRFAVDTGAQLSYINPQFVQGMESTGMRSDFHPLMGRYEVPVYDVNIDLAGIKLQAQCGASPALVQLAISMLGADGIIGYDLFASHKVVFDFPQRTMHIFNN